MRAAMGHSQQSSCLHAILRRSGQTLPQMQAALWTASTSIVTKLLPIPRLLRRCFGCFEERQRHFAASA